MRKNEYNFIHKEYLGVNDKTVSIKTGTNV